MKSIYYHDHGVIKSNIRKVLAIGAALALLSTAVLAALPRAEADTSSINFEAPTYSLGNINGQDGWSKTGPYDAEVVENTYGYGSFGDQSLRISNATTSGSFGDQTFSKSLAQEAGETSAENGGLSSGTRQRYFEAQWDIASTVPGAQQSGLNITASPDRGDGARMSWIQMVDEADGLAVNFYDYAVGNGVDTGPCNCEPFRYTEVVSGLDRSAPHTIKVTMNFLDGPENDVVKVYVDGTLMHTGTSWEDYFRNEEGNPTRTVDSILFRASGISAPGTAGEGFLIDNLSLNSSAYPVSGVISNPVSDGEHFTEGAVIPLTATYDDGDTVNDDNVQWAVRQGTCAASTGTLFGNVDGHSDVATWDGMNFSYNLDTTGLTPDDYCFVFNPTDDAGQANIRLTRTFFVDEIASPENKDECKKGGWESFGFKNQGQCVRFVETGKDSRV